VTPTRRTLLAAGAAVALTGCLDAIDGSPRNTPTHTPGGTPSDDFDVEVFQLGPSTTRPWWTTNEADTGFVTLLASERDEPWMVEDPASVEGLEAWLAETDFHRSAVVYVATAAPNTYYSELAIDAVGDEDDTIVGTAAAVDTSGEDEACATVETDPSAFVRVTGDGVPADATFTVTDGWGQTSEVAADGRYIDPAGLPGHVRPNGDPRKLQDFSCETDGFERHWSQSGNVPLGEAHNDEELTFAMRFHGTQTVAAGDDGSPRVGRGHEIRVTMRNVSTDYQYTGNRQKYALQVLTMDGWQDVRGTTEGPLGYTDEAIEHRPGEGFE
jgi:hypothetical protein